MTHTPGGGAELMDRLAARAVAPRREPQWGAARVATPTRADSIAISGERTVTHMDCKFDGKLLSFKLVLR